MIATVTTAKHALAAQQQGADAVMVTGHEAAAHGGEVTSLVLIPAIVDTVKIPVIACGGFADQRGVLAALALGAEAVIRVLPQCKKVLCTTTSNKMSLPKTNTIQFSLRTLMVCQHVT